MEDRFLTQENSVERLVFEYKKYKNLYIGFDFDNTVFDCHKINDTFPRMEKLLRFLKQNGFKLVLYTGNENKFLEKAVKYCKDHGYEPDYVNECPLTRPEHRKPMLSILMDDRAGMHEAYDTIIKMLNKVGFKYEDKKSSQINYGLLKDERCFKLVVPINKKEKSSEPKKMKQGFLTKLLLSFYHK